MLVAVLKLFICLYFVAVYTINCYHLNDGGGDGDYYNTNSKTDYINSKWKDKYHTTNWISSDHLRSTSNLYSNVRMRHSRYPNLDKVLTKIDNLQSTTTKPIHHNWKFSGYKITTTTSATTTTDEKLFGDSDYDDGDIDEDPDDLDTYDDWVNDADDKIDDTDDYEDDIFENNNDDTSWQAEEPTEKPARQSKLTEFKWRHYGTREGVEESRRNGITLRGNSDYEAVDAVVQHTLKVSAEGSCRKPIPKVIPVQKEYPDPSKTYLPHCTILHRCAEDTGCCSNYATRCAPKTQKIVQLYFYTNTVGSSGSKKVEKLNFYNHTECACLQISQNINKTTGTIEEHSTSPEINRNSGVRVRSATHTFQYPERIRRCKCPEQYMTMLQYNNRCSCDCTDGNQDCIRMKKGKEYFSLMDRKCILSGECGSPACEYGGYLRNKGRCPKKEEKLEAFGKMNIH